MDLQYLKRILKAFNESGVDELSIEEEGLKLKIKKSQQVNVEVQSSNLVNVPRPQVNIPHVPEKIAETPVETKKPVEKESSENYYEIKSPIVGTFYRSPSPDAEPFVKVGDKVSPGTVLCIIEAMKLMNEIESDVEGKIVKILVDNGKPVEYGQVLFQIEKSN